MRITIRCGTLHEVLPEKRDSVAGTIGSDASGGELRQRVGARRNSGGTLLELNLSQ
jgi:hypothetical protein